MQLTNIIFIPEVRNIKIKDNAHRPAKVKFSAGSRHPEIDSDL
jgi:hypothetical protein